MNNFATQSTRSYAIAILLLSPLAIAIHKNPSSNWWYCAIIVSAIAFFITSKFSNLKVKHCATLSILMTLSALIPSSHTASIASKMNLPIAYFSTYKVLTILVAMLAPFPHFLGYVILGLCLLIPPLQVLTISPEVLQASSQYEPWMTMSYSLVGLFVLHYRLNTFKLHANMIESQAKEKNLHDFADVALALRDLTNTPLQSLDLLIELLREEKISQKQASELLKKTTVRLRELMQVLSEQQKKITKEQIYQSMNSLDIIRQQFNPTKDD